MRQIILIVTTIIILTIVRPESAEASVGKSRNYISSYSMNARNDSTKTFDMNWVRSFKKPDEGLMKVLINYYKLPEPISRIFYCLALSNTKRFKDTALMQENNLYCLCDENNLGRYYHYSHWSESLADILSIYHKELGEDMYNVTDLLDCITSHYDRDKVKEMSKYHELYFGKKLPIRSDHDSELIKKKGGLPW